MRRKLGKAGLRSRHADCVFLIYNSGYTELYKSQDTQSGGFDLS